MLLDAPEKLSDSHDSHDSPAVAEPLSHHEIITTDEANAELQDVGSETQNAIGQAEADAQVEPSPVDEEERRFWMELDVLAKIADCSKNIEQCESAIDDCKCKIKDEKDLLKGEEIRLRRMASELADILSGKPLPVDPNKKDEADASEDSSQDGNEPNWRVMETGQLIDGVKGLGAKKVEALVEIAPTVGDLEDLRGQASREHKSFKEKLPSGFGQKAADAIEDRLIEHVAKSAPSAESQAAEERDDEDGDDSGAIAGQIQQREHDQIHDSDDSDDEYEDVADDEA